MSNDKMSYIDSIKGIVTVYVIIGSVCDGCLDSSV